MKHRARCLAWLTSLSCLALVLFAVCGARVQAATVLALDMAALVVQSDQIVIANAEAEHSRYRDGAKRGLIVTDVRLRVISALKGGARPGTELIATRLGGTVDEIGLSVPGEAAFPVGRSAIVFLRRALKSQELHVVGMSQGVLPISGQGDGAMVLPAGGAAELMQRGQDGHLVAAPAALTSATPLRDVLARISQLVSEAHAR